MLRDQKGFTLIELVMVIVILGFLAAVAVPKYVDLRTEAAEAAAEGVYGGASAATAVNFAARLFSPAGSTAITDATSLVAAMQGLPAGWVVGASGNTLQSDPGATYQITITTAESPTGATVPTQKATLSKNW